MSKSKLPEMTAEEVNTKIATIVGYVSTRYGACARIYRSRDLRSMSLEEVCARVEVSWDVGAELRVRPEYTFGSKALTDEVKIVVRVKVSSTDRDPAQALLVGEIVTTLAQIGALVEAAFGEGFRLVERTESPDDGHSDDVQDRIRRADEDQHESFLALKGLRASKAEERRATRGKK